LASKSTDTSAVINLSFVFNSLTEGDSFSVQKWTIRTNSLTVLSKDPGARWASLSIALRITTLLRDAMNECAHAWIAVALPMLFVGWDIVRVLAGSDKPPLIEKRDFTVHQSLYPFDAIHILEQR
jgi:hypothetical protein